MEAEVTVLRRDLSHINNYFNRLYEGVGHRGSSFADIDAVTHDGRTQRFLFQEFKHEGEPCSPGQLYLLRSLARLPGATCWYVLLQDDGDVRWADMRYETVDVISPERLRALFEQWWANGQGR